MLGNPSLRSILFFDHFFACTHSCSVSQKFSASRQHSTALTQKFTVLFHLHRWCQMKSETCVVPSHISSVILRSSTLSPSVKEFIWYKDGCGYKPNAHDNHCWQCCAIGRRLAAPLRYLFWVIRFVVPNSVFFTRLRDLWASGTGISASYHDPFFFNFFFYQGDYFPPSHGSLFVNRKLIGFDQDLIGIKSQCQVAPMFLIWVITPPAFYLPSK